MKLIFLFVTLFVCQDVLGQSNHSGNFVLLHHGPPPIKTKNAKAISPSLKYFTQWLDNFDYYNTKTWNMRYYSNAQFFKSGGPIFVMIGGEWEISPEFLQGGQMFDIAGQNGAAMFYTEHRYYGQSRPVLYLTTANLRYLNVPQALEDLAVFIRYLKSTSPYKTSKVVVFGGSYAGNLAIWMRLKYPGLIHAALSSSGPVQARVDFKEYLEVVQKAFENPSCYGVIKNGIVATQNYLSSGYTGIRRVQRDFRLCSPVNVNSVYDKEFFFATITWTFAGIVQYATGTDLTDACASLMDPSLPDDYARLASFVASRQASCSPSYQDFVNYYSSYSIDGDTRQWLYQTCNEFGYFQSTDSPNQPFGNTVPVDYYYRMCTDLFGSQYGQSTTETAAARTNANYKGQSVNVTRVVTYQGTFDPWSPLGLQKDMNSQGPVLRVPRTSHCLDLSSVSSSDPTDLRNAKLKEQALIKQWLSLP